MELSSSSHYEDLLNIVDEQQRLYGRGIAVSVVPSVMPRSNADPFIEGEALSGNIKCGDAEASLTITAAPHFRPSIPTESFGATAMRVFGAASQLPEGLAEDAQLAPHLLVWWRRNQGERSATMDLLDLARLSPPALADYTQAVASQTARALQALEEYPGRPAVYGTWGFGDLEQRKRTGLSRGGPSVPDGHLHVAKVHEATQDVSIREDVTNAQLLKRYQPWNRLINREFGPDVAVALAQGRPSLSVEHYAYVAQHADGRDSPQEGYEVTYDGPVPFREAFSLVVDLAGRVEELYGGMTELYEDWHKSGDDADVRADIVSCMNQQASAFGLSVDAAQRLTDFVLRIRPTLGQLRQWSREVNGSDDLPSSPRHTLASELDRRERLMKRAEKRGRESLIGALCLDTNKDPERGNIVHTWPARSSAAYLFDDIFVTDGEVWVNKFSILPAIVSTAGAPEKMLGVEIARDTGSA